MLTAVLVGTNVAHVLSEAINEVAISSVQLDAVKTSANGVPRRRRKILHDSLDLVDGQSSRYRSTLLVRKRTGGDNFDAFFLGDIWNGSPADMKELANYETPVPMHFVRDCFPSYDLILAPNAWRVGIAAAARRNRGRLL